MKKTSIIIFFLIIICCITNSQWTQVAQLNNLGETPSISSADCNTVIVAGGTTSSPVIYRSTNGGLNFADITTTDITYQLFSVWALNKDTIFAGDGGDAAGQGGNAKIYKTINGGLNWTVALSTGGFSGFINGIVFERPSQNFGIIVSDPPFATDSFWVAFTTNKGDSWNIKHAPHVALYCAQNSVFVIDNAFYGFGLNTTPPRFLMTSNGGTDWAVRTLGLGGNSVTSVAFKQDKLNGLAVSNASLPDFAFTSDGGINWQTQTITNGLFGFGIIKWVPGTNIYYICADSIKRTSNGGLTWELMNTNGIYNFEHMDLVAAGANNICAYALSGDGKVLKYAGEPFGIKRISSEIPQGFELKQNYPNPFNPMTIICFSIPPSREPDTKGRRDVFAVINIYNTLGKEMRKLISQYVVPGIYEVSFDGSDMPSGVYYYSLSVVETNRLNSGPVVFKDTKKMVLLK